MPTTSETDDDAVQHIEFPAGQAHGVTVYVQLQDDNRLYDLLMDAQRELNNDRGTNADSGDPHYLGEIDAPWTDDSDELGFFSSKVEYGEQRNESFTHYYAQVLNLYESVEDAAIANNPAKRRLEVHKRSSDLVYPDGEPYSWPAGWISGRQHEGTLLKIQASYVENPGNAIAHAFELLDATGLLSQHELAAVKCPIHETVRFRGLESHHRIHETHEHDAIESFRDSAKLVGNEGDGRIYGDFQKGHYQIYGFDSTRLDFLGFDTSISWTYRGDEYRDTVDKHSAKVYRHTSADQFPQTDPRAHPKIEVKAHGAFPGPAWPAVKHQLDTILNAHTSDLAGVPQSGLVEDEYHDGPDQATTVTASPSEYRTLLQDYFKSDGLKKQLIALLVNNRTDSAKDILYTIIRLGRPVPYDELKEETGLTKRTIRKWVRRLEELGIVERRMAACMFVTMTDFVREHLRGFLEKMRPNGDVKRAIRQRKHERIQARESDDRATPSPPTVVTDGGQRTARRPARSPAPDHVPRRQRDALGPSPLDRPPD